MEALIPDLAWFLDADDFADRTGICIEEDYETSDLDVVSFTGASRPLESAHQTVRYKANRPAWRYRDFDYFPITTSAPVISDRLKDLLQSNLSSSQIAFYPCIIRFSDGESTAWNAYPLHELRCIDEKQTNASWWAGDLSEGEKTLRYAEGIVLKKSCMQGLDIVRMAEKPSSILISKALKDLLSSAHTPGLVFRAPGDYHVGFKPSDWGR